MFNHLAPFSGFSVDDIEKAKKFYGEILKLKITEADGMTGIFYLHLSAQSKIVVYGKPNHVPATFTILNFPVDAIETAVDELSQLGVKFVMYDEPDFKTDEKGIFRGGGPQIAWFTDPAGNILSVIESKP